MLVIRVGTRTSLRKSGDRATLSETASIASSRRRFRSVSNECHPGGHNAASTRANPDYSRGVSYQDSRLRTITSNPRLRLPRLGSFSHTVATYTAPYKLRPYLINIHVFIIATLRAINVGVHERCDGGCLKFHRAFPIFSVSNGNVVQRQIKQHSVRMFPKIRVFLQKNDFPSTKIQ